MFAQRRDAVGIECPAGDGGVAFHVDAFCEPQTHEQELVGNFLAREQVVGGEPVPARLDLREPCLGAFLRRGGVAVAVDVEASVGAGPDAGIFVRPPVDEIVPAFAAGARMVRNLVGGQAVRGADLLRRVVESARDVLVRRFEFAGRMERCERCLLLAGRAIGANFRPEMRPGKGLAGVSRGNRPAISGQKRRRRR